PGISLRCAFYRSLKWKKDMEIALKDSTIAKVLSENAVKYGDKTFLTYVPDGRTFSYRDIDLKSNQLANGLKNQGIQKGSHIAVMMENCPEQLLISFALGKIGAVSVPINTAARGQQLAHLLKLSDAECLITEVALLDN